MVTRIRKTLDDDVFVPLYPKMYVPPISPFVESIGLLLAFIISIYRLLENTSLGANAFFQRQFWSCVKVSFKFVAGLLNFVLFKKNRKHPKFI